MKLKIQIKNCWPGSVLFEYEKEDNTVKDTLIKAVKNGADLRGANLGGANLRGANLGGAYLGDAYLRGAYLGDAKNIPFIPMACPSDGAFIGWKKVGRYLIKLEIPEDAKRSSATGTKCRCDKAKVLDIICIDDNSPLSEITNFNYVKTTYKKGEMVFPDSFNEDRWNECSNGIHFFINRQEAVEYNG